MRINKLDNDKLLYHQKVKNSPFFRNIESLVEKSKTPITESSAVKEKVRIQEQRMLEKKNNPTVHKSISCP